MTAGAYDVATDVVPDGIAGDDTILGTRAQSFPARQKEVRLGLAAQSALALHHNRIRPDTHSLQRGVNERAVAGCGYGVRDTRLPQGAEHFDHARQRPGQRHDLAEEYPMTPVNGFCFLCRERATAFALREADDQCPARPDLTVQPVAVHGHPRFVQGDLPGEHVPVDGIGQRAVQIEDQRVHGVSLARLADVVPWAEDRLPAVFVLEAEHAHAGRATEEDAPGGGCHAMPAGSDHPDDVAAGKRPARRRPGEIHPPDSRRGIIPS
jgi:hypothetical protein